MIDEKGKGKMSTLLPHCNTLRTLSSMREASLFNLVNSFLQVELAGLSIQTIEWYRKKLWALAEWLGPERSLSELEEGDLLTWRAWIVSPERGLASDTQHGHIRAARRLLSWISSTSDGPDLGRRLHQVPLKSFERRGISDSNYRRIVDAAQERSYRDYALLLFLADSGCRRAGVAGLLLDDLDLDLRRAHVVEKGHVPGTVFYTEVTALALEMWLEHRPDCDDQHVFIGRSPGQPWHGLSPCGISEIVRRYKADLGLKGPCSPHQFRHRLGRRLAERNMTLGTIAQVMRHQDPSITVKYYGGFANDELQDAYDETINKASRWRRSR